jgi:outer membrane protein OmpA-like peptidoglycan-associated protein
MKKQFKLALLGSCLLAVAACAAPNREPDLSNITANVEKTREGDFGEFLYNLVEAEDKAREAEDIHGAISQHPGYLYTNLPLRQRGVQLAEEAAEHRRKAEDAFNRILDPIRARLAYLESLHVPQDVGSMSKAVYFDTGSSSIRDGESAALEEAANFLSQYPIAHVEITAYTDTVGSTGSNKELARRRANSVLESLKKMGAPISASVAVTAVGEPEGAPDNDENQENRRVDIVVFPHGTYNKGQ